MKILRNSFPNSHIFLYSVFEEQPLQGAPNNSTSRNCMG